jgi:hypothetical protein
MSIQVGYIACIMQVTPGNRQSRRDSRHIRVWFPHDRNSVPILVHQFALEFDHDKLSVQDSWFPTSKTDVELTGNAFLKVKILRINSDRSLRVGLPVTEGISSMSLPIDLVLLDIKDVVKLLEQAKPFRLLRRSA